MKTPPRLILLALAVFFSSSISQAQILFQESFESNGAGSRYSIIDGLVSEPADHAANGVADSQAPGPVYFAHNFEVSFVGVRVPAAARRAVMTWHHGIPADAISDETKAALGATLDWLTDGRSSKTVLFSPPVVGDGDQAIADLLTAKGFTIQDDETGSPAPDPSTIALVVHTSSGSNPSRFTTYAAPLLTYNASDHDDELTSSIGQSNTQLTIETARSAGGHPASVSTTGDFTFVTGAHGYDTIGASLPADAVVVLEGVATVPAPVDSLAVVESMLNGSRQTTRTSGDFPLFNADLSAGAGGSHSGNNAVPGNPAGGFVTVATGKFDVFVPGVYSVGLGVDDGGRLRVDADRNGLTAEDTIIELDGTSAFREAAADVDFSAAGGYEFEWVSYNAGGAFGSEVSVTYAAGGGAQPPFSNLDQWVLLGDHLPEDGVQLDFDGIEVTTYILDEPPVQETRPLIAVLEAGQPLLGGPITGADGKGFFAGAGMNKFGTVDPNSIIFNDNINVASKDDLKLSFLVAGSDIDFENVDYLDALVAFNGSGDFERVVRFTAQSGSEKFISTGDIDVNPSFQEVTFDIPVPNGVTPQTLNLRFDFHSTWFNEVIALDNVRVHSGDLAPAIPDTPTLSFSHEGALTLTWDVGQLEGAASVTGPWEGVEGVSPLTLSTDQAAQFYRVRNP